MNRYTSLFSEHNRYFITYSKPNLYMYWEYNFATKTFDDKYQSNKSHDFCIITSVDVENAVRRSWHKWKKKQSKKEQQDNAITRTTGGINYDT